MIEFCKSILLRMSGDLIMLQPCGSLKRFKEHHVISDCQRRGFVPLYSDVNNFGFLAGTDDDPKEVVNFVGMLQLSHLWFHAGFDLMLSEYDSDAVSKLYAKYPNFSSMTVLARLYSFRHALELSMKSILSLKSIKYNQDSHNLNMLWNHVCPIFQDYDEKFGCNGNADQISAFIKWLDSMEFQADVDRHNGENPYRYYLSGKNQLMNGKKYINLSFISEYVMYFLSVVQCMAWDYVKSKPEFNDSIFRCDVFV